MPEVFGVYIDILIRNEQQGFSQAVLLRFEGLEKAIQTVLQFASVDNFLSNCNFSLNFTTHA